MTRPADTTHGLYLTALRQIGCEPGELEVTTDADGQADILVTKIAKASIPAIAIEVKFERPKETR